jgi:hypothetical protein
MTKFSWNLSYYIVNSYLQSHFNQKIESPIFDKSGSMPSKVNKELLKHQTFPLRPISTFIPSASGKGEEAYDVSPENSKKTCIFLHSK